MTLKELAMVYERYEVSDRAAAATALVTLKVFGVVTEEDKRYMWWIEASCEEKGKNTKKLETRSKNFLN